MFDPSKGEGSDGEPPDEWGITEWKWCPFAAEVIDHRQADRPPACACGVPHTHDDLFIRPAPSDRQEG